MKVRVDKDEWYPVYSLSDYEHHSEIELTEEEFSFIKDAEERFDKAQEILSSKYKGKSYY